MKLSKSSWLFRLAKYNDADAYREGSSINLCGVVKDAVATLLKMLVISLIFSTTVGMVSYVIWDAFFSILTWHQTGLWFGSPGLLIISVLGIGFGLPIACIGTYYKFGDQIEQAGSIQSLRQYSSKLCLKVDLV